MENCDAMHRFAWDELLDAGTNALRIPDVKHCVISGAVSPFGTETTTSPIGDVAYEIPAPVDIHWLPPQLTTLELSLVGDVELRLPYGSHSIEIRVTSVGASHWFSTLGGSVRSLVAVDSHIGCAVESHVVVLGTVPTRADVIRMECTENDGLWIGSIETGQLIVTGTGFLIIGRAPLGEVSDSRATSVSVASGRIFLSSTLSVGSLSEGSRISCTSSTAVVVLGDSIDLAETKRLVVTGGHLKVLRGEVSQLEMIDVEQLDVGDFSTSTVHAEIAARQLLAAKFGYGLVTQVSGNVRVLNLCERATVAGDARTGFSADRVAAPVNAEISGLRAGSFNLNSAGVLRDLRRLGLWVNPSTHKARKHFEAQVRKAETEPEPALFELAHHRKQMLGLAVDSQQDGHTLSVLREAEKDARRATSSWRSRERMLLELWRRCLGYGERIGYPLALGSVLIFLLGIGQIGWAQFWSRGWWAGWSHIARINRLINFALPGIPGLGIDGIGGFWGVSAKIVSVVFFASAATAAIRVVKRGE